jgi:hypothetical protein
LGQEIIGWVKENGCIIRSWIGRIFIGIVKSTLCVLRKDFGSTTKGNINGES